MERDNGPMLRCDPRAVRIAFWCLYAMVAILLFAALVRALGVA